MNNYIEAIRKALHSLDIKNGDILYVASDITLLMNDARKKLGIKTKEERNEFLNQLMDCFQTLVGDYGTLLFPVFTWDFCRHKAFDILNDKGETGALGNWILDNRKDFKRTQHPLYSFMVWGRYSEQLLSMNNKSSWGQDSPFYFLHHNQAKLLLFNVSLQRGFTFMHYVEQSIHVPYRYMKDFFGTYIDENGNKSPRVYSMYVRDLDIESKEYLPDKFLDDTGITKKAKIDTMNFKIVDLAKSYEIVADDLRNNKAGNCYIFYNYDLDWEKGATHDDQISN